jgi:hypothetical protein
MSAIAGKWYAASNEHDGYPAPAGTVRFVYATQPDGDRYIVAKVWSGDDGDYEGTARLVAAAPSMLAVLRQAQADLELLDESGDEVGWRNMDATEVDQLIGHLLYTVDKCINRAEGRTDG